MSSFCLCVTNIQEKMKMFYEQRLCNIAQHHKRGIVFSIDWFEPTVSLRGKNSFFANLLDSPVSDNCEMLLLPDGWYYNGSTNVLGFRRRMEFLQDIANELVAENGFVEFYIGCSGTELQEYRSILIKNENLIDCLEMLFGVSGIDEGIHIVVQE